MEVRNEKANMKTDVFNRLIDATKGFVSKYARNDVYQFIKLEFHSSDDEVIAVATDGFKLSVEHAVCKSEEDFTIYVKGNVKLPRNAEVEIELEADEALFRCNGFVFGYKQPTGQFLEWPQVLPSGEPTFRIGFNGEYLLAALKAARISVGGLYKNPVVLEFRGPTLPFIIKTNNNDIKMVLPIRVGD